MPEHQGLGHVTFTVHDLDASADFYNRVFGIQTVDRSEDAVGPYAVCAGPGMMVGLRKYEETPEGDVFHYERIGVDHVGISIANQEELEKWRAHLDEQGVVNSGIVPSPYGLHLNAKDPDGIALEFFAPAG